tara:strand:- start:1561 stop:2154 length:594 start_codon:yes stop_codon:yes gene_type:complete
VLQSTFKLLCSKGKATKTSRKMVQAIQRMTSGKYFIDLKKDKNIQLDADFFNNCGTSGILQYIIDAEKYHGKRELASHARPAVKFICSNRHELNYTLATLSECDFSVNSKRKLAELTSTATSPPHKGGKHGQPPMHKSPPPTLFNADKDEIPPPPPLPAPRVSSSDEDEPPGFPPGFYQTKMSPRVSSDEDDDPPGW